MIAPRLETERLILRPHERADFADLHAMWSDLEVTRHISGRASTAEESWARLLRYAGHWAMLAFGYWALQDRKTGRFIGEAGLADYQREIEPPFAGAPEAGWVLAQRAHGQGFATEAMSAILAWADAHLPAGPTVCIISPAHQPSVHVAEKLGYERRDERPYKGQQVTVFERGHRAAVGIATPGRE